jgi:N-acetylglucosamine-6-sulfatase
MLFRRTLGALALLGLSLAPVASTTATTRAATQRPNIVVIMTDDMRFDQLHVMKTVMSQLAGQGRSFNDYFATGVICCPSRTSFLRGQYVHTHSVYETVDSSDDPNDPYARYSGGVWAKAVGVDQPTIANWLQDLGYFTAESGKFLNSYPGLQPPSGWNFWRQKLGNYTNFKVVVNGKYVRYGKNAYEADVVTNYAIDGIHAAGTNPLFLWLAYFAPHEPWTPPARYSTNAKAPQCKNQKITQLPSFNEASRDAVDGMNDKPAWESRTPYTAAEAKDLGVTRLVKGCRTLLAVDDNIKKVIAALNAKDPGLDNTIIVFTSDQGVEDGQHMQGDKKVVYDETIHLPFIVRADGLLGGTPSVDDTHLLTNIDLAPTLVELAGGDPTTIHPGCPNSDDKFEDACEARGGGFDGYSFAPLLTGQGAYTPREDFLIEHWSPLAKTEIGDDPPAFCAVRTMDTKLIRYWRGPDLGVDWEAYDLATDPNELHSLVYTGADGEPAFRGNGQSIYDALHPRLVTLCDPTPPEYPPFS